jgi:hypothetical protein
MSQWLITVNSGGCVVTMLIYFLISIRHLLEPTPHHLAFNGMTLFLHQILKPIILSRTRYLQSETDGFIRLRTETSKELS